jgi:hypothetical protein
MSDIASFLGASAYQDAKLQKIKNQAAKSSALTAPDKPLDWVLAIYRSIFSRPFGPQHTELFEWAWSVKPKVRSAPFVAIWSRGFGKSTTAETIAVMLGAREQRKYLLYVSETQELADSHLLAIRGMIESPILKAYYPVFAAPKISKEGHSRGWRHNRLYCGNGYVIDAIGLDTAKRGSRIMDARPDFMIFDDIDAKGDSPTITRRKIDTITTSLLPAGSVDASAMFVQNMIIDTGVFAQLAQPNPPFLKNRVLSGPFPALKNFSWHMQPSGKIVVEGEPTWESIGLSDCQRIVEEIGITAFRSEYQHEITNEGALFEHVKFSRISASDVPPTWRRIVAVDPAVTSEDGSDSHGICVAGIDDNGQIYVYDSWERRETPEHCLRKALYYAVKYNADRVIIEGNQGNDLWYTLWNKIVEDSGLDDDRIPGVEIVKATSSTGSKMERASQMLVDYELGRISHVINDRNTYIDLEGSLRRFPLRKPFDLTDACFWAWSDLRNSSTWLMG